MPKANTSKKVILVVDDDPMVLRLYERIFQKRGIEILLASGGEEGFKIIQKENPNFVILDIMMPKIDGIEVLERMKENKKTKDIPVLILTNYGSDEHRRRAEELGVVDFVLKVNAKPSSIVQSILDFFESKSNNQK